jgi:hypothetical protein
MKSDMKHKISYYDHNMIFHTHINHDNEKQMRSNLRSKLKGIIKYHNIFRI